MLLHALDSSVPLSYITDPHGGHEVRSLTWSHNNMIVASAGANSCSVSLARTSDGTIIQAVELCPRGISITDIAFSATSVFIAFGCDDASVGVVNVRTKRVEASLRDHDPAYSIRAVSLNCYDTLLASGSSDGELFVNALTLDANSGSSSGAGATRIFRDRSARASITTVRFSLTKRHVLASAYDSGMICVWDLQ